MNRPASSPDAPAGPPRAPAPGSSRVGVAEPPAMAPHDGQKRASSGTRLEQAEQEITAAIYRVLHPLVHRTVVAARGAGINLARAGDLLLLIEQHLLPLREPAGGARDGEQNREGLHGELHALVDQARVEVDVGIQ